MNDVRLAMLGDGAAQERLTERGELLPCPMCGKTGVLRSINSNKTFFACCPACGLMTRAYKGHEKASLAWNTRAPIMSSEEMEMLEGVEK